MRIIFKSQENYFLVNIKTLVMRNVSLVKHHTVYKYVYIHFFNGFFFVLYFFFNVLLVLTYGRRLMVKASDPGSVMYFNSFN